MSFRYRSALLSLVSLALIYAWYFALVLRDRARHVDDGGVPRLIGVVVAIAVVQIVGHVVIAATSADRYSAMDERERAFDRRATSAGYYLMIAGAMGAAATMHFGATRPEMANAMLLAIVIAECSRQAMFLIQHHRAT
jgi:hypothetical protein